MNAIAWWMLAEKLVAPEAMITGDLLAQIGEATLTRLESARVLLPRKPRATLGTCPCGAPRCERVVQKIRGKVYAVCPVGQWPHEEVTHASLRAFSLNDFEFLRRFAEANHLQPTIREIDEALILIGEVPGTHRETVVLVRRLRWGGVPALRGILKVAFNTPGSLILFPGDPKLSDGNRALLALDGHRLINLSGALKLGGGLRIELGTPATEPTAPRPAKVRLLVHTTSRVAKLDGHELKLQPRTIDVLAYLAARVSEDRFPIPPSAIFSHVWEKANADDVAFYQSQVDEHVSRIRIAFRQTLGISPQEARDLVFNAKGKGYGLALAPNEVLVEA